MTRRFWFLFYALCPLALLGGILLQVHNVRKERFDEFQLTTDRARATQAAQVFLKSQGIETAGWTAYIGAATDAKLYTYLRSRTSHVAVGVRDVVQPAAARVLFQSPNGQRRAVVKLSLQGRVLGFDFHNAIEPLKTADQNSVEEQRTARDSLMADPKLRVFFERSVPEIATIEQGGGASLRKYTWRAPAGSAHELELEFTTTVQNARVLSRDLKATVDEDYAAHNLGTHPSLTAVFGICYSLFVGVVAIYSVVTYVRRAAQKEVSHARMMWISLLVAFLMIGVVLTGLNESMIETSARENPIPLGFVFTLICLAFVGLGLLVGFAYSSGEGEVREAYAGKLTSLDALLLGKVFSRNVGASVLVGMAFASWLLLSSQVLQAPFAGNQQEESLNALHLYFMNAPWISFLFAQPAIGLIFAIGGLLQPLAFVTRTISNRKVRIAVLVFLTALAAAGAATSHVSLSGLIIALLTAVPGLLIPFFAYDFLAALVSFIGVNFISSLVNVSLVFPGWQAFTISMAAIITATVAVEFLAWRRGRTWKDDEVRPEYARHISERLALQEEVAAAREAQLRLLPQSPPFIPGLSIFASCQPAHVVGGDFYDFFLLSEGRLGIFVAEGGNRGLASALTIALAKGYLMHASRRGCPPAEVIHQLEATLGAVLEGNTVKTTVAYAVLDVRRGTLSYARTGAYPKVLVTRPGSRSILSERQMDNIREGHVNLEEGDGIIFYTDGIARRLSGRTSMLQEDWIRNLADGQPDANALHGSLLQSVGAPLGKDPGELEDDLTAIVIRFTRTEVASLAEGVA